MGRTMWLLVLLMCVPGIAQAQHEQARQGFGISVGIGGGTAGLSCEAVCGGPRESGISGYLRLGGYVGQGLFVGVETNGWTGTEPGIDEAMSFLSGVVLVYPQPKSGFYLKGGLGLAGASATGALPTLLGIDDMTSAGLGLNLGAGYDWRVGRNFSLTPYATYLRSVGAELRVNGIATGEALNFDAFQFGLGFTWH